MKRMSAETTLTIAELRARATITIGEAAAFLNVSADLAYDAARRGELPCVTLGRRKLVICARLLEMLSLEEK